MTTDYCSADELGEQFNLSDTDDHDKMGLAITAASRQIDRFCGQRFYQDDAVVVREFYADSSTCVDLLEQGNAPISTTTGLVVKTDDALDGTFATTLTIGTDFLLLPRNAAADDRPFTEILVIGSYYFPRPYTGRAGIQVTAKFGWPEVPADVKQACIIQAAQLFKLKDAVFGAAAVGDAGAMFLRSALNPSAKALLGDFQRAPVG